MAREKLVQINENNTDGITWLYVCDTEADLANAPADMVMAFVCTPSGNHKQVWVKNTEGTFVEVK